MAMSFAPRRLEYRGLHYPSFKIGEAHCLTTKKVAVKAIRPYTSDEADTNKKNKRLHRELKVWARLHHKNIWPLLGVTVGFGPFTAMVCPWASNGTLNAYLGRYHCQLSTRDRFLLLSGVSQGLSYLHSHSIIHGDLTGTNILIDGSGIAYIADFGLSIMLADFMGTSNTTSSTRGNVRWAAPELFGVHGDSNVPPMSPSALSDIYSFGSIMFQVLSGQLPYSDLRNDRQVLVKMMFGGTPSRPTNLPIANEHWGFIQRCWAPLRERRRPSSDEAVKFVTRATPLQ
ncbi:kinase-like protein [Gyrodon lividus]|nr:kinase-like protein [Gyrodon lividus]